VTPPKSTLFRCENGHELYIKVPQTCMEMDQRWNENHECFECGKPLRLVDGHATDHLDREARKELLHGE